MCAKEWVNVEEFVCMYECYIATLYMCILCIAVLLRVFFLHIRHWNSHFELNHSLGRFFFFSSFLLQLFTKYLQRNEHFRSCSAALLSPVLHLICCFFLLLLLLIFRLLFVCVSFSFAKTFLDWHRCWCCRFDYAYSSRWASFESVFGCFFPLKFVPFA